MPYTCHGCQYVYYQGGGNIRTFVCRLDELRQRSPTVVRQIVVVRQRVQARARPTKISSSEVRRDEGVRPGHIDPLRISIEARRNAKDSLLILVHIRIRTSFLVGLSFRSFRSFNSDGGKRGDKLQ